MSSASVCARAAGAQPRRRQLSRALTITGFLLPAGLVYCWLVLLPVAQAAYYSLFRWNGLGPLQNMVGLGNYARILRDSVFLGALGHNLLIILLSLAVQLPLALGLALLVGRSLPGRAVFRTIFFLPYVLSEVVAGVIWMFIYRPGNGLVDALLQQVAPGIQATALLADPKTVLLALFGVMTWKYFGYHMILFVAGLQNIPAELEEAARIDGCGRWQVLRHITLPLLGSTLRLTVYLAVLGSLQIFDLVWVMTQGGPVNASDTMATYLYKFGFQRFQLGYGSAVAVLMFAICFGFSVFYQRAVMRRDFE